MSSSSYTSDFVNLFGIDIRKDEAMSNSNNNDDDNSNSRNGRNSVGAAGSVPPAALLTEGPAQASHMGNAHSANNANVTPSILLEQLAYVDNFMPSLEQDFATLDSWIMPDNNEHGGRGDGTPGSNSHSMGFDERLAVELSAFADESFIFPDEDKRPINDNDGDNGIVTGDNNNESGRTIQSNSHFLTQRRNTFLTSQYDHSKSRFSRKRDLKHADSAGENNNNNGSNNNNNSSDLVNDVDTFDSRIASPVLDHGGFTNVDIVSNNNVAASRSSLYSSSHAPNVPSPLTNMVANQPYSVSNSPLEIVSRASGSAAFPGAANGHPRIQMPDYSTIPTSTLVALLPRVTVPPGAYRSLIDQGLSSEQIDAIAVIIAHHEQEKIKQKFNDAKPVNQNSIANLNSNDGQTSRSVNLLLDLLSHGNSSTQLNQKRSSHSPPNFESNDNHKKFKTAQDKQDERRHSLLKNSPLRSSDVEIDVKKETVKSEEVSSVDEKKDSTIHDGDFKNENLLRPKKSITSESSTQSMKKMDNSTAFSSSILPARKSHQKKKLRETELETSVHELNELAVSLQQKIHTLEMENKLLKDLVISSGESEGIENAKNIKRELLAKINGKKNLNGKDSKKLLERTDK